MNILIFPHLGLGDQFVMNGYIHNLLNIAYPLEEICIIAKQYQQKTLEHLYSDFPQVSFYWIQETSEISGSSWEENDLFLKAINKAPFGSQVLYKGKVFTLHNFGIHTNIPFFKDRPTWADGFYLQANTDPQIRHRFIFPSNMKDSAELYMNVVQQIGKDYILIHDDPTRERFVDTNLLSTILTKNNSFHLPILYLGRNRYSYALQKNLNNKGSNELLQVNSILDYYDLIKNAKECHFMDSSIGIMTNFIKESESKLYNHIYITTDEGENLETFKINTTRDWTYIRKNYA